MQPKKTAAYGGRQQCTSRVVRARIHRRDNDLGCVTGFANLDFQTYSGVQHSIGPQELQDIRAFILEILPEQALKVPTRSAADWPTCKQILKTSGTVLCFQ